MASAPPSAPAADATRELLKRNNFDLLRFLFAGTVFLVHAHILTGRQELAFLSELLSSEVAVRAFFVVSGILVFMSYETSSDLRTYASKRVRRIYPAYFTVVVLCALGLALLSTRPWTAYFSVDWLKYLAANLAFLNFLHPTLPGVFEGHAYPEVNGALWTLKIEVMFYMAIPLIVLCFRRFGRLPVMALVYAGSVAWSMVFAHLAEATGRPLHAVLARQLPGQMCYFISGAFLYYYLGLFRRHALLFVAPSLLVLVLHRYFPLPVLEPFALAAVVGGCGFFAYAGRFGRYGDFSYGVYILHFPIIQVLVVLGWFERSPFGALALAAALLLAGSILMWHCVEKPALYRTSHYVVTEHAGSR